MKSISFPIPRRKFLIGAGVFVSTAAGLSVLQSERGVRTPAKIFIDLHNAPADSYEVADRFVHANSPTLIASYVVFYRNFLNRWSRERLDLIKDIKDAALKVSSHYKIDSHRLVALPAVVAAHILPRINDDNPEKEELWQEISQALHNPKVEVREIVLQNLITATYSKDDPVRRFSLDQQVLIALDAIIEDARHTDKLLSPLCLCTQLLLNTRSLYLTRRAKHRVKDINNRRVAKLLRQASPNLLAPC